jgi:hypothetical protein
MATVQKLNRVIPNTGGVLYTNVAGVGLANGDQSLPIDCGASLVTKCWQVTGTFGAAGSVQVEESDDGTNWFINGAAKTFATLVDFSSASRFLRFNVTAGDGTTSLFVSLYIVPQRGS